MEPRNGRKVVTRAPDRVVDRIYQEAGGRDNDNKEEMRAGQSVRRNVEQRHCGWVTR